MNRSRQQSGQAMSEFLVAAAFVVVPLFIIVPVVGKYIDMKQAAVEAARYSAWEFTVNYGAGDAQPRGFDGYRVAEMPVKSGVQVTREAERRLFSNTAIVIDTHVDRSGYRSADANPLWRYHNGLPMYQPGPTSAVRALGPLDTPDVTGMARGFVRLFGALGDFIAALLQKAGVSAGFDAIDTHGKYSADVDLRVRPAPSITGLSSADRNPLFLKPLNLGMLARAAVLGESWDAGGRAHTVYQSGGLIPGVLLDQALNRVVPLQSIASTILISPELKPDSLIFGYPTGNPAVMDEVPPGKLLDDERGVDCGKGGYCVY